MKECKKHGVLTVDQIRSYVRNRRGRKELTFGCKLCHRETASQARNLDRTKANEWERENRKKHPEVYKARVKKYKDKVGSEALNTREIARVRGIPEQIYLKMMAESDNKCQICRNEENRINRTGKGITRLCLDHCHTTGKIRGLLCHSCNTAIGKFRDSIDLLEKAIEYLKKHE